MVILPIKWFLASYFACIILLDKRISIINDLLYRPLQNCTGCNDHNSKPQDFYFKNYELRIGNVCVRYMYLEFPLYHTTNLLKNLYTIKNFNECVTINNY